MSAKIDQLAKDIIQKVERITDLARNPAAKAEDITATTAQLRTLVEEMQNQPQEELAQAGEKVLEVTASLQSMGQTLRDSQGSIQNSLNDLGARMKAAHQYNKNK